MTATLLLPHHGASVGGHMRKAVLIIFIIAILSLWALWGAFAYLLPRHALDGIDLTGAGQWGDSFGPFNALLSAAGFIILAFTLNLQRRAIKDQADDLHRQRFEGSFFELLRLMRELRAEVSFEHSSDYLESKAKINPASSRSIRKRDLEAINAANIEMRYWLRKGGFAGDVPKDELSRIYIRYVHRKTEATLAPYFRTIYGILDRIRQDKILTDHEKSSYGNILRGQLTSHEIALLSINALSPVAKDLKDLLIEFRMLKYLPATLTRRRLKNIYPEKAFLGRD